MKSLIIISAILMTISACTCFGCGSSGDPGWPGDPDECGTSIPDLTIVSDTTACSEEGVCSGLILTIDCGKASGVCGEGGNGTCTESSTTITNICEIRETFSGSCTFPSIESCDSDVETYYCIYPEYYYCDE